VKIPLTVTGFGCMGFFFLSTLGTLAADTTALPDVIEKIKPAIVAVGAFQKTRRPPSIFRGTGFVIADGLHVVTNAHVVPEKVDTEGKEVVAVFVRQVSSKYVKLRKSPRIAIMIWRYSELLVARSPQ